MGNNENIEYKKGWQEERNKDNPKALHQLFSNDKIIHGMDASLNIGMAESVNKEFETIFREAKEAELKEQLEKMQESVMGREEIKDTFKNFLFSLPRNLDDDTTEVEVPVPRSVILAIQSVLLGGWR